MSDEHTNPKKRGFAAMSPELQREIASRGGKAAHAKGTAHRFTSEEAKIAGQKGGSTVSADRTHMSRIGSIGGKERGVVKTRVTRENPMPPSHSNAAFVDDDFGDESSDIA
jgi:general stress protein YciG